MLTQFIESNFQKALEIQSEFFHDERMVSSIRSEELTEQMVKDWMRAYGLFQGLNSEIRNYVANEFIAFAYENNKEIEFDIEEKFKELHSKLQKISNRKWISATSKLLWCIDPNNVIIYDSFVERAVGILQCLDENLANYPRLNQAPDVRNNTDSRNITNYYMNYQNLVKEIINSNKAVIQRLKEQYNSEHKYMYDVRIIDKLLWIMGNTKASFEYNEIKCMPIK